MNYYVLMKKTINQPMKVSEVMNNITIKNNTNLTTIDDFYEVIKMNMNTHMKSFFNIARDIHTASKALTEKDFLKLLKKLNLAKATTYKLKSIIKSAYTEYLLDNNRLPQSWTVAEKITKLEKKDFDKIKDKIEFDISAKVLDQLLNKKSVVSNNRQPLSITITCKNNEAYKYLSKKIEVLIKQTDAHLKIANSVVLKLPTKKVSI